MNKDKNTFAIFIGIVFIILGALIILFKIGLSAFIVNNILREGLTDMGSPLTNHDVNLPINTAYGCNNKCGPAAKCSITGEQCIADIDCYGCRPNIHKEEKYDDKYVNISAYNDAGILTYNQNPRMSVLTTDIGTQASIYNSENPYVPQPYLGVNTWRNTFDDGMKIYEKKMTYQYSAAPGFMDNLPSYPVTQTVTGLFNDYGPTSANANL
jgi:hypothetical protein